MTELRIRSVSFTGDTMTVRFSDDREIAIPLSYFSRLQAAGAAERNQWSLIGRGLGVHWEALDEDLSVENILLAYSRHHKESYAQTVGS
jgi:Protein of unknown function (DUF2442)